MTKLIRVEQKAFTLDEVKAEDDAKGLFSGYAAIFGNKDLGGDIIQPGAFTKSLDEMRKKGGVSVPVLWQHNRDEPIGICESCDEDKKGLRVRARLNLNVQRGRDAYEHLKFGSVKGMSIGYVTRQHDMDYQNQARLLKEVDLMEWSLVTIPMNPVATVESFKSLFGDVRTIRDFEDLLREAAGLTREEAKIFVSRGFKALEAFREEKRASEHADSRQREADAVEAVKRLREAVTGFGNAISNTR